jgi:predicted nucleic acid-binding protein
MNEAADRAFLDTNVLIYADQRRNKNHRAARLLRDRGQRGEVALCISPQVLSEFYAFMTRTDGRGLEKPLPPSEAAEEVRKYLESEHIRMIYPIPGTWPLILESLLKQRPVSGLDIHDLHLAATMLSNGVKRIYTFNTKDFEPLADIEVLTPPEPEPEKDEPSTQLD